MVTPVCDKCRRRAGYVAQRHARAAKAMRQKTALGPRRHSCETPTQLEGKSGPEWPGLPWAPAIVAEHARSRRAPRQPGYGSAATTAAPITIHLLPPLRRSEGSRLGTGRKGGDCDPRGDQTKRNVPHDLPHFAGLLLWQCTQQRGNRTPALTRYFPMATIQASNWWSTSSSVPAPGRFAGMAT
jgi:hypothetical protein